MEMTFYISHDHWWERKHHFTKRQLLFYRATSASLLLKNESKWIEENCKFDVFCRKMPVMYKGHLCYKFCFESFGECIYFALVWK
jgi:hypothetical protein